MRTYEKYKDSGISWIGEIPEGWEKKRLKYVSSCNDEILPETTNPNKQIEYVEIGDVVNGMGIVNSTIYPFAKAPSRARRITQKGDIIISTVRTYLKAIAKVNKNGLIVSTGFAVIRPQKVNSSLLAYILQSPYFVDRVMSKSVGVSYPAINASQISNIEIAIPTYAEQEAIANYLDKKTAEIDKIIAEREKKIELLNELKSSIISRAVTKGINSHAKMKDSGIDWIGEIPEDWEVCHLKAVFKLKTGTTPKFFEEDKSINKVDWYTPGDFNEDFILGNSKRKLDKETFETKNFDYFPANSILLVGIGAAGKVACTSKKCYSNQQITALLPNRNLNSLYIMLYLRGISDYLLKTAPYTTLPILSNAYMSRVNILLPPLEEQNNIVQHVLSKTRKMEHDINLIQSEITLLREYKQSLISEVVTGKRKVID